MRKQQRKHRASVVWEKMVRAWDKDMYQWRIDTGRYRDHPSVYDICLWLGGEEKVPSFKSGPWDDNKEPSITVYTEYTIPSSREDLEADVSFITSTELGGT